MLVIDAANVVGSRPDGWWKDRPGATRTLVAQVRAGVALGALTAPVVVVVEGAARPGAAEGVAEGVQVVHAPGHGDDTVVSVATATTGTVVVVSADRALGDRCRAAGAAVVGPTWLLDRLER